MSWLLLAFFAWQFLHFQKQNLGMAALGRVVAGHRPPSPSNGGRSWRPGSLASWRYGAPRPAAARRRSGTARLFGLARIGFGAAVVVGAVPWRRPPARPIGLRGGLRHGTLFSLPIFVFASPYAAVGGMTIAHGLQYLSWSGSSRATRARRTGRRMAPVDVGAPRRRRPERHVAPARSRPAPRSSSAPTSEPSWPTSSSTPACGACETRSPGCSWPPCSPRLRPGPTVRSTGSP